MSYIDEEALAEKLKQVRRDQAELNNRRRYLLMKLKGTPIPACQPCSMELVSSTSATLIDWSEQRVVNSNAIILGVADYFNVSPHLLVKRTRKREVVVVRQIAMYLLKKKTHLSLKAIGEMFGGRDHTTVIHSCATVKNLMDTDEVYARNVAYLDNANF